MSSLALRVINIYRRHVSHRKGFRCAHHALHGQGSCSDFGLTLALQVGLFGLVRPLLQRFSECRAAAVTLSAAHEDKQKREQEGNSPERKCTLETLDCCTYGVLSPW